MGIVFITAIGVGGATILGGIIGLIFRKSSPLVNDLLLSFAAGVMLSAALIGLILPAMDSFPWMGLLGFLGGVLTVSFADFIVPKLYRIIGIHTTGSSLQKSELDKALLLFAAIAIHNIPEGLAAGVSFGCSQLSEAVLIAGGIALQNIPEGMVTITPMLNAGIPAGKTFLCALFTGCCEILGTFVGYWIIRSCAWLLPAALGFAGGTMLYIIIDEMIPDTHRRSNNRLASYMLIMGFCVVFVSNYFFL